MVDAAEPLDRRAGPVEVLGVRLPGERGGDGPPNGSTRGWRRSSRSIGSSPNAGRALNVDTSAAKTSRSRANRTASCQVGSSSAVARMAERRTIAHRVDLPADAICGPRRCRSAERPAMSSVTRCRTARRSPSSARSTRAVDVRSASARPAATRASAPRAAVSGLAGNRKGASASVTTVPRPVSHSRVTA